MAALIPYFIKEIKDNKINVIYKELMFILVMIPE